MASYSSKGRTRDVLKTRKGRVVYDRPPHRFSERDLERIARALAEGGNGVTTVLTLLRIAGGILATTLLELVAARNPMGLASFLVQIMQTVYQRVLKDVIFLGDFGEDFILEQLGFIPSDETLPKPKPPAPI